MTQSIRRFLVIVLLVAATAATGSGQMPDPLEAVCTTSQSIVAYSATIRMTQHQAQNDSVIEFVFDFVPPDRMRIVYTAPATVVGQTMILNADRFYTFIPSLHRSVWKDVGEDASNPGEEMGFLYDFVTRAASEALEQALVDIADSPETFVLESTNEMFEVDVLTLLTDEERQVVRLNALDAAPVAIAIYNGDELAMEIRVLDYRINGAIDEAWFAIPEQ
jgi:outer membrane lipoprotein-sorting protein